MAIHFTFTKGLTNDLHVGVAPGDSPIYWNGHFAIDLGLCTPIMHCRYHEVGMDGWNELIILHVIIGRMG